MSVKIRSSQKRTDLKWLNMFEVAYIDKNGRNRSWQVASRAKEPKCITKKFAVPDAVVIVPWHSAENKIVITREYRIPLADFEYGFPAGLIDAGETIEQASRRELKEETGLEVTRFTGISPPIYSSAGMSDESVVMVYVECDGNPSTANNTGSEVIEVELISPSQAFRLCENPSLKFDAKAWLVLSGFAKYGHL
jgi:ADP-ribose pyrophosphatase